jgi:hypothetical protein
MKSYRCRTPKGIHTTLGMLLLCALSSQNAIAVDSSVVGISDYPIDSLSMVPSADRPSDRDMIRPPIIPRIPPR